MLSDPNPLTESAPLPAKRTSVLSRIFRTRFLVISIGIHLLLGVIATIWVVQQYGTSRKLTFKAGPPSPNRSTRAIEHKVQMAKKQSTMSAPPLKRVVSTGLSKITLPAMPALPATAAPAAMMGAGGMTAGSTGAPGGSAGPSGGGGLVSLFGLRAGSGLAGTFYDLKQTADGRPTDMALRPGEVDGWNGRNEPENKPYDKVAERLISGGMSTSVLASYFHGPSNLFTTQIFIPAIPAANGPKAFMLGDNVQPKRWMVLYRGKATPPESGHYRFVGYGDDLLIVRLDNRIAFDGSLTNPTKDPRKLTHQLEGLPPNFMAPVGQTFEVRAGSSYPIEILIGERPGGEFSAFLLLEKVDGGAPTTGAVKLPIFKLAPSEMPARGTLLPVVAPDTSWSVWR